MKEQLQAIVTVLLLVNPVIYGAMFARIESGRFAAELRSDAMKVALTVLDTNRAAQWDGPNRWDAS